MQKNYLHNYKSISENKDQKINIPIQNINQKMNVDINKLLNRIRMDKKSENKKKIIFYSSTILVLGLFSTLLTIIR
tara:strand:+ start:478 stop:705 length:228 start_codon:yes stop_codon:yes gene_type:complete